VVSHKNSIWVKRGWEVPAGAGAIQNGQAIF
jgi:hypothetical protein